MKNFFWKTSLQKDDKGFPIYEVLVYHSHYSSIPKYWNWIRLMHYHNCNALLIVHPNSYVFLKYDKLKYEKGEYNVEFKVHNKSNYVVTHSKSIQVLLDLPSVFNSSIFSRNESFELKMWMKTASKLLF